MNQRQVKFSRAKLAACLPDDRYPELSASPASIHATTISGQTCAVETIVVADWQAAGLIKSSVQVIAQVIG